MSNLLNVLCAITDTTKGIAAGLFILVVFGLFIWKLFIKKEDYPTNNGQGGAGGVGDGDNKGDENLEKVI